MQFLTPILIRDQCPVSEITAEYEHLLMPFGQSRQTQGKFGTVLTQFFKGDDYAVWQHHFFIKEKIALYGFTAEPILSINYMLRGTPVAHLAGIGAVPLEADTYQLFYVPSINQEVWFEPGDYHCIHVVFDPADLRKMQDRHSDLQQLVTYAFLQSEDILPHASGKITHKIKTLLKRIVQAKGDLGETDISRRLCALELLLIYMSKHHAVKFSPPVVHLSDGEQIEEVGRFIIENLSSELSIEQLARHLGKSKSEFHRLFKAHFGQSPYHFILTQRMEQAMKLIRETVYSIGSVSLMVGFDDIPNFNKIFKRYFGESPGHFRNNEGT